jgi:hypothetical protein
MKQFLKTLINPNIPLTILLIIVPLLVWIAGFSTVPAGTGNYWLAGIFSHFSPLSVSLTANILSMAITLFNVFLLAQINNKFTVIRTRTFLPMLIFLVLISGWNRTHTQVTAHITLTLFILALFVFFSMYRNWRASEPAFLGSFLISLASLLTTPVILLIPVCWLGFMRSYSFSLRTFLASVFGALAPWILYIAVRYYIQPDMLWLTPLADSFLISWSVLMLPVNELVYMALMTIFILIGLTGLYYNLHSDSIQTRVKLNYLMFILVFSFVFSMIFSRYFEIFMPVVAFSYSLLLAHSFTLRANKFYGVLFVLFLIFNIVFAISEILY